MVSRSLGHRAPLLWLVLPYGMGLLLARLAEPAGSGWPLGLAAAGAIVALLAALRDWPRVLWVTGIVTAFGAAGVARYQGTTPPPETEPRPARETVLQLRVERTFATRDARKSAGLGRVVQAPDIFRELLGQRVYFAGLVAPGVPRPRRSAVMTVEGVLAPLPARPAADTFEGFLAAAGIRQRLTRGWIRAEAIPPSPYYAFCDRAVRRFRVILGLGIEERQPRLTGLLRAMMLGETRELTDEQREVFMQSGTMHLFAISGLNIGVIALAIQSLLLLVRLGSWSRFLIGSPLLWLFVDITGAAPSAVRAFAMAVFFHAAFVLRRPPNPIAALVASAAVVLLVAPLQFFGASFLMSYAIVLVLLLLGLPLAEHWEERAALWRDLPKATWRPWQTALDGAWRKFVLAVAVGVATSLVGMLTSVQFFKLVTPGAFVANLVLIPAAMLVTLGGFAALLFGLIGCASWAALCNHASALVLLVIEQLVRHGVRVPGAYITAEFRAPWIGGAALTLLTATLIAGYAGRWNHGLRWAPFVVVALTLAAGVRYQL
ncbi:ComEC/Rec2 family competence protein [Opitutus sp. ER46]|uniref:ComEC/Rec2 family competence protein n=1 Tax=Opitutus sp. ER46 TaxID=2161864 RepID=UPI000D2FB528|nr:ComEC/Rec2 family competence protein [Opitutus sp. ER46]PTX91797.1 competence protein ComEC [Opitutus sp. ER46]